MPLLDNEQQNAFANAVSGETPSEAPAQASEPATEVEPEQPAEAEAPGNTQEEAQGAEETEEEHPHQVPYNRFKSVIDARNEYKEQLKEREEQLLYIQRELEQRRTPQQQRQQRQQRPVDDPWAELLDSGGDDDRDTSDPSDPTEHRIRMLESRYEEMDTYRVQRSLEEEVSVAVSKFPGVPERAIYEAIAGNGSLTAHDAAKQYSEFVGGIQEAAIARYVEEQSQLKNSAAKRPRTNSGQQGAPGDPAAPRTMEDAHKALLAVLKN